MKIPLITYIERGVAIKNLPNFPVYTMRLQYGNEVICQMSEAELNLYGLTIIQPKE